MSVVIELNAKYEAKHAGVLIRTLAEGDVQGASDILLDLQNMSFYEPLPLCIILATVRRWREKEGKKVEIKYYSNTRGGSYAERMDFFTHLGLAVNSGRQRHNANDNFITIREIRTGTDCSALSGEVADCLVKDLSGAQGVETKRLMQYLLGEVIMNCKQHSRGIGYLHGQYFKCEGIFHLALADDGIGVLRSYKEQGSPRYFEHATDVDMLTEALTVESSSTTHKRGMFGEESPNRGVGLPMCRALAADSYGIFSMHSGSAFVFDDFSKDQESQMSPSFFKSSYPGVAVSIGFTRGAVGQVSFEQILAEIRIKLKLQNPSNSADSGGGFI
jgi:hypothetical protein